MAVPSPLAYNYAEKQDSKGLQGIFPVTLLVKVEGFSLVNTVVLLVEK